ncbi:MAG: hypothetical protein GY827_05295 [Cytophagales bacterium]|nr:hypothetical protein [Cytophagales bacterium]
MDKLQRYNQKLLAVFGTLITAGSAILIIIGLFTFIKDYIKRNNRHTTNDHSLTIDTSNVNNNIIKIKQEISFEKAQLIDTVKRTYLIPVAQVNLEKSYNR